MSVDPKAMVGRVLASRYRLEAHLGRGAMGDVFRARHVKVPRLFAVKVLLPELVSDPKVCKRFEREAELAGRLRHRNVTSVIDVGETDGTRYMVMDFAEGRDLGTLMNGQPVDGARTIRLFRQIVEGLEHAHAHDVVHRDLKPENVIVELAGEEEIARVVDFGVAILREGASSEHGRLTTGGLVIGTPHYMAPELATGKAFDHRVDLFALGVILFEMLTGVMPYEGDGVEVALSNIKVATPPMSLRAPNVEVDPLLEALTRKLMEKQADHRPQSAREVRLLLDLITTDRDAAARALGLDAPRTAAPSQPPPIAVATGESTPAEPPRVEVSTRELLRLANRRSRYASRTAAIALVLGVFAAVLALRDHTDASAPMLDAVADEAPAALPELATMPDDVPAVELDERVQVAIATPVAPATPLPVAIAKPAVPARPPLETGAPDVRNVITMYSSLGRELKTIADRRDMAADDLWMRYRRIRIQDAVASSTKRAEAMNELSQIDQEIEKRFRKSAELRPRS